MRLKGLLAALLLAFPGAALASPGTPQVIGTNTVSVSPAGTNVITTTADAPAGQPIIVACGTGGTTFSASDTAGNTYTADTQYTYNTTGKLLIFYMANPVHLAAGGTITMTWSTSVRSSCTAATLPGIVNVSPIDVEGASAANTGQNFSVTLTPTAATSNGGDLLIGINSVVGNPGTYTEASGPPVFNTMTQPAVTSTTNMAWAYSTITTNTLVTYNPSWNTSHVYGGNVYAFKAAASSGGATRALMGEGK